MLVAERLTLVLRVVLVMAGALVLLDLWGVSGSPIATWKRVMDAGFAAGSLRVTVGRVRLGADPETAAEGEDSLLRADRGLAESITRLKQSALATPGTIFALALIGVEPNNFAIIAGALGIGGGFGLQNEVNNFASGPILLFERPGRAGNTVVSWERHAERSRRSGSVRRSC